MRASVGKQVEIGIVYPKATDSVLIERPSQRETKLVNTANISSRTECKPQSNLSTKNSKVY